MTRTAAALTLLLASACVPGEGPSMRPFEDCIGCHAASGDAKSWTVAGTWAKGATITVTDANGRTVAMRGNDVGNFYTREALAFPYTVSVNGTPMKDSTSGAVIQVRYGGCNACHRAETVTVGPLMAPGSDCLVRHSPTGMASGHPFSAAGTFPNFPVGTTVQVDGQTTTTNAVGNFYIAAPIDFSTPQTARVGGSAMEGGTTYGGCNRCHVGGRAGD